MVKCEQCNTRANFGLMNKRAQFCTKHKTVGMVDVNNKHCEQNECPVTCPRYDLLGGKGRFCVKHKITGMVDVITKHCEQCTTQARYDIPGGKGRFCIIHKTKEMVDIKTGHCHHKGCNSISPGFNIPGKKGRFCIIHKTTEMVNVRNKRCEQNGCIIISPNYDIPGGKGRFCVKHKVTGMIDVKTRRCEHEGCTILNPIFDIPNGRGRFCTTHKQPGMINVRSKRCEEKDCTVLNPSFNMPGEKGRFCSIHKTDGMINVKTKYCEHDKCITHAWYGLPGNPATRCAKHRQPGMLANPRTKCKTSGCKEIALYGQNFKPFHCEQHKTDTDENYVERACVKCGLTMVLDSANLCEYCVPATNRRAVLAKQNALTDYLQARKDIPSPTTIDKTVEGGVCGKERPDVVYETPAKIVIVECDEHQHRERQCECEQTRMVNIGQSYGGLPVYFLRWNPDAYCPENSRKEPDSITKRHTLCGDVIRDILNEKIALPNALVSAIYLYYDGWNGFTNDWKIITEYE